MLFGLTSNKLSSSFTDSQIASQSLKCQTNVKGATLKWQNRVKCRGFFLGRAAKFVEILEVRA